MSYVVCSIDLLVHTNLADDFPTCDRSCEFPFLFWIRTKGQFQCCSGLLYNTPISYLWGDSYDQFALRVPVNSTPHGAHSAGSALTSEAALLFAKTGTQITQRLWHFIYQ